MGLPFKPQLPVDAADVDEALAGRPGAIEPKLDGWRMLAQVTPVGEVRLWGRSGTELTAHLPEVCEALTVLPPDTILDGEAVSRNDEWGTVQSVLGGGPKGPEWREPIFYAAFDVVRFAAHGIGQLAYADRREVVERAVSAIEDSFGPEARVRAVPSVEATQEAYERMVATGFEGGVVKLLDSTYQPGRRGGGWYRIKYSATMDVIATGFVEGTGKRAGEVGAIEFAQYRDGELVSRGACGTGFTYGPDGNGRWIWEHRDELLGRVFEIRYWIGIGDTPRTPSFVRWREDKLPSECTWTEIRPGVATPA